MFLKKNRDLLFKTFLFEKIWNFWKICKTRQVRNNFLKKQEKRQKCKKKGAKIRKLKNIYQKLESSDKKGEIVYTLLQIEISQLNYNSKITVVRKLDGPLKFKLKDQTSFYSYFVCSKYNWRVIIEISTMLTLEKINVNWVYFSLSWNWFSIS